jgi:hypothetical protein
MESLHVILAFLAGLAALPGELVDCSSDFVFRDSATNLQVWEKLDSVRYCKFTGERNVS